jgi:hypothetical protein
MQIYDTLKLKGDILMIQKKWLLLAAALFIVIPVFAEKGAGNKQRNKPVWEMTEYQKDLPPIEVIEGGETKLYSFKELIEADGYLCPGSARVYTSLLTSLPLLFKDEIPQKNDVYIKFGPSDCADKVLHYFLGPDDNNLKQDQALMGREIIIQRISTDERIRIVFDEPAADGHTPDGAAAGETVLKAKNGTGLVLTQY